MDGRRWGFVSFGFYSASSYCRFRRYRSDGSGGRAWRWSFWRRRTPAASRRRRPLRPAAFFLFELVDEIDEIKELTSGPGANDGRGDADGEMGFACASSADEDRVAPGVEESAHGEFANRAFIDRRIGEAGSLFRG